MLPSRFRPQTMNDFIGPARSAALLMQEIIAASTEKNDPIAFLILGKPGIGKSELAEFALRELQSHQWNTTKLNGTQLKIDMAEEIAASLRLTDLFGGYRILRIEEVDSVPTVAQVRLLTLVDDLPRKTAIIATSNCKLELLEPRFQSRFTVINLDPPTTEEIKTFLMDRFKLSEQDATGCTTFCCGNVRQALKDADTAVATARIIAKAAA